MLGVGRPDAQYFLDQGVQGADVPRGADVAERGGDVPRHADYLEMEADASDVDDVNSEDEYDLLQVSCLWLLNSWKPMATFEVPKDITTPYILSQRTAQKVVITVTRLCALPRFGGCDFLGLYSPRKFLANKEYKANYESLHFVSHRPLYSSKLTLSLQKWRANEAIDLSKCRLIKFHWMHPKGSIGSFCDMGNSLI